jgi:hypothetical protein
MKPMQITLNQDEILAAIDSHVRSQINIASGQSVSIELKATRGDTGFTAILDIVAVSRVIDTVSAAPTATVLAPATTDKPSGLGNAKAPATPVAVKPVFGKLKAAAPAPAPEPEPVSPEEEDLPEADDNEGQDEDLAEAAVRHVDEVEEAPEAEPAPAPRSIFSKAKG